MTLHSVQFKHWLMHTNQIISSSFTCTGQFTLMLQRSYKEKEEENWAPEGLCGKACREDRKMMEEEYAIKYSYISCSIGLHSVPMLLLETSVTHHNERGLKQEVTRARLITALSVLCSDGKRLYLHQLCEQTNSFNQTGFHNAALWEKSDSVCDYQPRLTKIVEKYNYAAC